MAIVYLCLGSNMGDRFNLLQNTVSMFTLIKACSIIRTSAIYETEPWGNVKQGWFLNVVVEMKTTLTPEELLMKCQEIERFMGRERSKEVRWGERVIDIDIILYDKEVMNKDNLVIPHQYMHKRAFVLVPLLELIPDFEHPVLDKTISELYDDLEVVEDVVLYGTKPSTVQE